MSIPEWRRCLTTLAVAFSVLGTVPMGAPAAGQDSLETSLDYLVEPGAYDNSVRVASASSISYPRLAIDLDPTSPRHGTLYVVGLHLSGGSDPCSNLTVIRSFDGGRTFDEPFVSSTCLAGLTVDVVAGRNGTLFAASWGPRFLRSTDGGRSWEILATLGNASSGPSLSRNSATDGLHLSWSSATQSDFGGVLMATSEDEGLTWTPPVPILPGGVLGLSPQITAHGNSTVIGLIAMNGSDPFVGAVSSLDRGATWGNVSALTASAACLRWSAPSTSVSRTGVFAVSWYQDLTTTECWSDWGNETQTFVALSMDGGRTFSSPQLAGGPPGWHTLGFGDAFAFDDAGRMYVTWHSIGFNWTSASVYVSNSTSPGAEFESASFTTRLQVSGGNSTAQENLALGLNDTVYLIWVAFDPSGDVNRSGIFVRAVAGEAEGDIDLTSSTSASVGVEVRDTTTGRVAFRGTWSGSPLALAEAPPATYEVWVTVGNESSRSGNMPIGTWGRTSFTIHVTPAGAMPPPLGGFPWQVVAVAGLAITAGSAVLIVVQHTRIARKAVLQREVRGLMYGFIREHPGVSFSQVRDALGLQNGIAAYHLNVLERQGLLHSERRRRHRWYYPEGDAAAWQNLPLSPLQSSLLDVVRRQPGIGVRELARTLDRRTSSVAYNVKALAREGHLLTEQAGRKLRCYPADGSNSG